MFFRIGNYNNFLVQASKYGIIGIINTSFHASIFFCLTFKGVSQALSNCIAFSCAVCLSYILNTYFTFKQKPVFRKFFRMFGVMLGISYLCGILADITNIPSWITFVLYCLISYLVGFILSKYFVFK